MYTVLKAKPKTSNDFDAIRIKIASPEEIRSWSSGEVKKAETINYRTLRPEPDGLFCAKIFGPTKDYECLCGKYKGIKFRGTVCERCGVEITESRVRRHRMGHIELAVPVAHIWYLSSIPSIISILTGIKAKDLERVVYYQAYIVTKSEIKDFSPGDIIAESEYDAIKQEYGNKIEADMGAKALSEILSNMDLDSLRSELIAAQNATSSIATKKKISRRLKIVEYFIRSENRPEWMILSVLPVIPPDLRPLVSLEGGRFASSDLNDLYRRVINRNNRLKKLIKLNAPSIILRNEERMLQEAIDSLLDNGKRNQVVRRSNRLPLKSLSDNLKGKQGRFRRNLLGKRVDYSGRSVIVSGPELSFDQCGLPREMALELYKPFVYHLLEEKGYATTLKAAKHQVERREEHIWEILEEAVKEHPVFLNRAPTLHRLSIQGFFPVLTDDKAIHLHPLACPAFNADFDGDQMAVHLPLSDESCAEAVMLMLAHNNVISPANGNIIAKPSQDMVLGIYYITKLKQGAKGESMVFADKDEAICWYNAGHIAVNALIKVRIEGKLVDTTAGRLLVYNLLPEGFPFSQVNKLIKKSDIANIADKVYEEYGNISTIKFLDGIKDLGFKMAALSGSSISIKDMIVPEKKQEILDDSQKKVDEIVEQYKAGLLTERERYNKVIDIWSSATSKIGTETMKELGNNQNGFNPIFMMKDSGARGSDEQIRQMSGVRGLMIKPSGDIVELPIKSNLREGMSVLEYFTSSHGARKGLSDTALKTANAGYLTRKLIDVAQNVIVTEKDCGTTNGIEVAQISVSGTVIEDMYERIAGRVAAENIVDPFSKEEFVKSGEVITKKLARKIAELGINRVKIRSVLTCRAQNGVCATCYGNDLTTGRLVEIGTPVGIIAAQSIGEPGTQLTLRTFHGGGAASTGDEKVFASTNKAGFVRFYNMKVATNSNGDRVVLSRRDAMILITEPFLVSSDAASIEIEEDFRGYIYKINGKEYRISKSSLLNQSDFAHGGETAIGKLRLLVKESGKVERNSIIVERVLEVWDVPNKITYGAKIYVNDGDALIRFLKASKPGQIEIWELDGDKMVRSSQSEEVVKKYGTHVFIRDNKGSIVERYYAPVGSKLAVKDGDRVKKGDLLAYKDDKEELDRFISDKSIYKSEVMLADWDAYSSYILSSQDGTVDFKDIVADKTLKDEVDRITGLRSRTIVESVDARLSPRIVVKDETGSSEYFLPPRTVLLKNIGDYVKAGDVLGKIPKETAKTSDITGGLPRVVEIVEAKSPKVPAIISEISGEVSYGKEIRGKKTVYITSAGGMEREYVIPRNRRIQVYPHDHVEAGEPITDGVVNPADILRILGEKQLAKHLVGEVQQVYKMQGVDINDKHFEVIVRQMLKWVMVEDPGESGLIQGEIVNRYKFEQMNRKLVGDGKKPALARILFLGITRASLATDSFVSAASFQETKRVLTDASIRGATDILEGLKENVIVGRLIPAGTGQKRLENVSVVLQNNA